MQLRNVQLRRAAETQNLVLDFSSVLYHLKVLGILVLQHALGGALRTPPEPAARTGGGLGFRV